MGEEYQEALGTALRLLAVSAFRYYLATLEGDPAPRVAKERDQLQAPQPGDWVMEISTIWDERSDFDRIGRLILVRDEALPNAYEQEENDFNFNDGGEVRERYTYIERLDGTVFRWHNCEFMRLFEDVRSDEEIDVTTPAQSTDGLRLNWVSSARQRHRL